MDTIKGVFDSPLLKDTEIKGARYILLNISSGIKEATMDEIMTITDFIQDKAGSSADIIWGSCLDASLKDKISVTIIATGFKNTGQNNEVKQTKITVLTKDDSIDDKIQIAIENILKFREMTMRMRRGKY
ncbi:MAG: hypothetical protein K2Q03_01900 [Sphingobacteriaceae bacterium]|nr:hypothetical protein [Sphingobacteriaceae bacterium]